MKTQAKVIPVSAFVYRGPSDREAIADSLSRKTRDLHLVGQHEAGDAAAKAAERLKRERKEPALKDALIPLTLIRDLGGKNDPISRMLNKRYLTPAQGWAAVLLRGHEQAETISVGSGSGMVYVDGKSSGGAEERHDRLNTGRIAWERAKQAVEIDWKPVRLVIKGETTTAKAIGKLGGDTTRTGLKLRYAVHDALDAAVAFMGVG